MGRDSHHARAGIYALHNEVKDFCAMHNECRMIAIELNREAGSARRYCEALAKRDVLATDAHDHIIRISPPLTIKREEADWAIERIAAVLTDRTL